MHYFRISVVVVLLANILFVSITAKSYEGYKLYQLTPKGEEDINILQNLSKQVERFDFLNSETVIVEPNSLKEFENALEKYQLEYKLLDEDVGKTLTRNFEVNRLMKTLKPYKGQERLSTERYYSHGEINAYLEYLAQTYPQRVILKTMGYSFEGRALKAITITNGQGSYDKNVILVDGGFHAREWISPASAIYAIEQLVENFEANKELLADYNWVILPVVNADGYEYTQVSADTRMWRKTRKPLFHEGGICYGTDPNRNFDFHWNEEGASSDPCSNTFAGPKAFSEPEAMVVRDLIHTNSVKGQMYLTLHSQGKLLLYPWGWTDALPDTWEDLHEVAAAGADAIYQATGTNYTVGSSTTVLYVAAGASDDYAFNAGFPIAFTMELPGAGSTGFDPPVEMIDELVKETWVGIKAMGLKVIEKYPVV
ncbi:carboxypeptidase B1 [Calliphora vicina]|uniref:carboxypeptidase B1 n=1 Tax=Calliphora vicina TaxID=7373 RepID=UPI00325B77B0